MSTITEIVPVFATASAATAVAAALSYLMRPLLLEQKDRREKARAKLKAQLQKKLQSNIKLEAHEISDIGRGLGLSTAQSVEALYELYSETEDQEQHANFKSLLTEINRAEPFESFPAEVRPSLARLSFICNETTQESDKELLHPITKVLTEYQDMKKDHASIKKQSRVSYVVALISFFVGVFGLVLAFTGPSKEFIAAELEKSTASIQEQIKATQQSAPVDAPTAARSGRL